MPSKKKISSIKPPVRNQGSGQNPNSRRGGANLNRKGRKRKGESDLAKPYPSEWENFLIEYKLRGGIARACAEVGISTGTGMNILRDPRTPAIVRKIDEEILQAKIEMAAVRFALDESTIDEAMFRILRHCRYPEHQVSAGIALYKRMKLWPEPAKIINNNSAQALAGQLNGTDAFQVYEAGWLTEKEATWGTELTQKVRHFLATSLPEPAPPPNVEAPKSE